MDLVLPERLRPALKQPIGLLVPDLSKAREHLSAKCIISVGDKVTDALLSMGVSPNVCVYDGRTKRNDIGISKEITAYNARELRVKNPPGTISAEAKKTLCAAIISGRRTRIMVDGEEDLLTLVAVSCAPIGAIVVYGQPDEGAVVIKIDESIKQRIEKILDEMRTK